MKFSKDNHERLEKALTTAYHEKESPEVNESWQMKVMSNIRKLGPLNAKTDSLMLFEQVVWRFAPVACLLILTLTAFMINLDFIPAYEMTKISMNDPIELTFAQLWGL